MRILSRPKKVKSKAHEAAAFDPDNRGVIVLFSASSAYTPREKAIGEW